MQLRGEQGVLMKQTWDGSPGLGDEAAEQGLVVVGVDQIRSKTADHAADVQHHGSIQKRLLPGQTGSAGTEYRPVGDAVYGKCCRFSGLMVVAEQMDIDVRFGAEGAGLSYQRLGALQGWERAAIHMENLQRAPPRFPRTSCMEVR